MRWEEQTAPTFPAAVERAQGVCLLPLGVIEKHGDHLPLGQDGLSAHAISVRAAEEEPVVVFPPHWYGSINEARNHPGTVALRYDLLLPVLESLCEEIARNGFGKIIIVNGHGGNAGLLGSLFDRWREQAHAALIYVLDVWIVDKPAGLMQSVFDGHAGETETSMALALYPHLVSCDTPADYGRAKQRMQAVSRAHLRTPIDWYAKYPGHLAGDSTPCTPERGEALIGLMVAQLVEAVRTVKNDAAGPAVYREFLDACDLG